jgi:dihydrofolate reductase
MRKLILQMQASVDGYVAGREGLGWQLWGWGDDWPWDDRLKEDFNAVFAAVDCILLSRKMLGERDGEGYIDHWTRAAGDHPTDPDYAFARKIVVASKVVVTSQQVSVRWPRTTVARGGLSDQVNALKRQPGADVIAFGGVSFATALLAHGLVDELQLFVNPTAIGAGNTPFAGRERPLRLTLLRSDAYPCGMVVNRYAPGR